MTGGPVVAAPEQGDADAAQLARFGYGQELKRVLNLFENFAVAFCYISPVVGITRCSSWVSAQGARGTSGCCRSSSWDNSLSHWSSPSSGATIQ